jgi:hypothetical protein
MAIEIRSEGRRHYLVGDTYPIRAQIKEAGCRWDPERKAWYSGKRETAEAAAATAAAQSPQQASQPQAPGEDAIVAGRARYKGRTYYLAGRLVRGRTQYDDTVATVGSRDGSRVLLYFRDGSSQFWARWDQIVTEREYQRPTTIRRLREFAAEQRGIQDGTVECPVCQRNCTCGTGQFCHHHHDGCDRCGAEG